MKLYHHPATTTSRIAQKFALDYEIQAGTLERGKHQNSVAV